MKCVMDKDGKVVRLSDVGAELVVREHGRKYVPKWKHPAYAHKAKKLKGKANG